ncbi:MAG: hypothetical protein IPL28_07245 [Chloroflexi bacterium]|nr:hypothetical protein [Chloroflexota bacterium]
MTHILAICTANICRSPVVEAVLRNRLQAQGLNDWEVSSAGTWATQRRSASEFSVEVVQEREGLDLTRHQSRGLRPPCWPKQTWFCVWNLAMPKRCGRSSLTMPPRCLCSPKWSTTAALTSATRMVARVMGMSKW